MQTELILLVVQQVLAQGTCSITVISCNAHSREIQAVVQGALTSCKSTALRIGFCWGLDSYLSYLGWFRPKLLGKVAASLRARSSNGGQTNLEAKESTTLAEVYK